MLSIGAKNIYFHRDPVDMRKGFNGLNKLVESKFTALILDGGLFLFINKRRNLMKILYWDNDGFALWYKRLEQGTFKILKDGKTELSRRDFSMLFEGIEPRKMNKRFFL